VEGRQIVTAYSFVVAFTLPRGQPWNSVEQEAAAASLRIVLTREWIDKLGGADGPVDVAVREVTPGTGKLTRGEWGINGI
jgi:hypothetical protein